MGSSLETSWRRFRLLQPHVRRSGFGPGPSCSRQQVVYKGFEVLSFVHSPNTALSLCDCSGVTSCWEHGPPQLYRRVIFKPAWSCRRVFQDLHILNLELSAPPHPSQIQRKIQERKAPSLGGGSPAIRARLIHPRCNIILQDFSKSDCKQVFRTRRCTLFMQQLGKGQDLHINAAALGLDLRASGIERPTELMKSIKALGRAVTLSLIIRCASLHRASSRAGLGSFTSTQDILFI